MKIALICERYNLETGARVSKEVKVFDNSVNFLDTWEAWKERADREQKRFEHRFYSVNRTKPEPPPEVLPDKSDDEYWCPYCASIRDFWMVPKTNTVCCTVCEVSLGEYYVKKYNSDKIREIKE